MTQQEFRLLNIEDIGTGEIKSARFAKDQGSYFVDDSTGGTEIPHNLGVTPVILTLVPTTQGVMGYVQEKDRSATSITLKANVSGVHVKYTVLG